jgi:hypothetical protein
MYLGPIATFKVQRDCRLTSAALPLINCYPQPYIPHIALMYAAGVKEADTIFCSVSGHLIFILPVLNAFVGQNQTHKTFLSRRLQVSQESRSKRSTSLTCLRKTPFLSTARMYNLSRSPCARRRGIISVMDQTGRTTCQCTIMMVRWTILSMTILILLLYRCRRVF